MDKRQFVTRLQDHVDQGSTNLFFSSFDIFSSSKNNYKGEVDAEGFTLRRRRKLFDFNMNFALAKGTFRQRNNTLIIETEINAFGKMALVMFIFILVFYSFIAIIFLLVDASDNNALLIMFPLLLFHGTFMMLIPYIIMRDSTKKMKYELERDLYYLTKE